jgi:hypothetical protein
MPWIFTYSDLGPQVVEKLLGRAPFCSLPASLPNYKVVFKGRSRKWGGALATLEKTRKSWVYGSALLLTPGEMKTITKYYSAFEPKDLTVRLDATEDKIKARTFFLKTTLPYADPSEDYTKAILKHLKFFWGQTGSGKMGLSNFNINEAPPEKKARAEKPKPQKAETQKDEQEQEQEQEQKTTPKKTRRRRTMKKK